MPERQGFFIVKGPEFTAVANALRVVDSTLPAQPRKKLKDGVRPLVAEAKRKVINLPVQGRAGSTGLRRRVARGVDTRSAVGQNPALRVTTSRAQPNEAVIPRGLDSPLGWRHPVFGNMNTWVTQRPLVPGWFTETFASGHDEIERSLTEALEWARDTIAASGGAPRPGA
jgi:hypothetical protein